jgi:hypothetical protein
MDTSTILRSITVTPDDLLLDPNNPRLIQNLNIGEKIEDSQIQANQQRIKDLFIDKSMARGDEFTDITDLYDSMIRIGYVGIDRIVVRELSGQDKYLVIEGNRRVSTIKLIRDRASKKSFKEAELESYKQVSDSFEKLDVLVLKTEGLAPEEIEHRVSIILGLRHFGSVLDWRPINRAFNAYQNYMAADPPQDEFVFNNTRVMDVASRLSVSKGQVTKALKTYIVYRQLAELDRDVEDGHYSLIEAGIALSTFGYFKQHPSTFKLDDSSLSKLDSLCQFEQRKEAKTGTLIISEPKKFGVLGQILKISHNHDNETVRKRAEELIISIERGEIEEHTGELSMSVDKALSLLTAEINQKEWVKTVNGLLDAQEEELPVSAYDGEGNHLLAKEELEKAIVHLRTIFGI